MRVVIYIYNLVPRVLRLLYPFVSPFLISQRVTFKLSTSIVPKNNYHSCDKGVVSQIIQHGLIPGGWPKSSGRAHSYFIATHPWDANMKKLSGTRAGKPFYVAIDVEMAMQVGARLFRTDEAIMTPDWIPNETIICVYNAAEREFYWSNRAYAAGRKSYNERVKRSKDQGDSVVQALTQSKRGRSMDLLFEQWS